MWFSVYAEEKFKTIINGRETRNTKEGKISYTSLKLTIVNTNRL